MTLQKLIYLTLVASLVIFAACSSSSEPQEEPTDEFALVAAVGDDYFGTYTTASGGVNITMDQLYTNLEDGDTSNDPVIIDYRSVTHYNAKHIRGAINVSINDLVAKVNDGTIPLDENVVNVCYTGQNASVATSTINLLGGDAQNLKFGMCGVTNDIALVPETDKWDNQIASDEFTPVKTGPGAPTTTYALPNPNSGQKTASDIIKANFSNVLAGWGKLASDVIANYDDYHIMNYWGADDYNNIGHHEGAYQYTPMTSIQSDALLNTLPTDKPVIVYCWTGQTSAQVAPYLRILGYDAYSMYYGMNGCSFTSLPDGKPKYHAPDPSDKFSAVLVATD